MKLKLNETEIDENETWLNVKLMKLQVGKLANWWNGKLMKQRVVKTASWQNTNSMKWQVDLKTSHHKIRAVCHPHSFHFESKKSENKGKKYRDGVLAEWKLRKFDKILRYLPIRNGSLSFPSLIDQIRV